MIRLILSLVGTLLILSCADTGSSISVVDNDEELLNFPQSKNPESAPLKLETSFNVYTDVAVPMTKLVDDQYRSHRQLGKKRSISSSTHQSDLCASIPQNNSSFGERIAWAVDQKMKQTVPRFGYVASLFGVSSNESTYMKTGLISHPLCYVSKSALNTTFQGKNIPSNATLNKVNKFVATMNEYRRQAYAGSETGYLKAEKLWSKFFMCLSYMESLTTADSNKSYSTADKYLPDNLTKSPGVSFYEDPKQPSESYLNVGLFQFGPFSNGDVQSCIREWNEIHPSCQISKTASYNEMLKVVSSSHQTFNSFCAVAKVTGMFGVQVNTTKSLNTFPTNVQRDGSLAPRESRCVSFNMNVKTSYNHFAPLQNGSGFTLDQIISCTLNGEI